jgi:hypothetical protein
MYGRTPAASNRRLQAWEFVQLLGLNFFTVLVNECVVLQADKFWIAGLVFTKFMPLGLDLGTFAKQFLQRLLALSRLPSVLPRASIQVPGDGFSWNCLLESLLQSSLAEKFVKRSLVSRGITVHEMALMNYSCVAEGLRKICRGKETSILCGTPLTRRRPKLVAGPHTCGKGRAHDNIWRSKHNVAVHLLYKYARQWIKKYKHDLWSAATKRRETKKLKQLYNRHYDMFSLTVAI